MKLIQNMPEGKSSKGATQRSLGDAIRRPNLAYKRPLDLAILILTHFNPVLIPVWVLLWTVIPLLIWLEDRGPIFFLQGRVGLSGRRFMMIKFRSMRTRGTAESWPGFTERDDPRVTRVGRLLRRLALDELPQIINLWKGEISFVGPRPLPTDMHEGYLREDRDFSERLVVRPGLTGLAQIRLRRHASARSRSRFDRLYIRKASLWLDLKLIFLSLWFTLTGQWGKGRRETGEAVR